MYLNKVMITSSLASTQKPGHSTYYYAVILFKVWFYSKARSLNILLCSYLVQGVVLLKGQVTQHTTMQLSYSRCGSTQKPGHSTYYYAVILFKVWFYSKARSLNILLCSYLVQGVVLLKSQVTQHTTMQLSCSRCGSTQKPGHSTYYYAVILFKVWFYSKARSLNILLCSYLVQGVVLLKSQVTQHTTMQLSCSRCGSTQRPGH